MSKEIEKRFVNYDRLFIESKLKEIGAKKKGMFLFKIIQFKSTPPIKTLRIRDEGFRITFTVKEKTQDYDIENEVNIDNFNEMKNILKKLGYEEKYFMEKIREIYEFDDSELIFDHYPGLPGYIEIEAPSEEKLKELSTYFNLNFNEKFYNFSILYNELYDTGDINLTPEKLNITFSNVNELIKPLIKKNKNDFEKILDGQLKLLEKVDNK
jgi:adenylate cyclase class 2